MSCRRICCPIQVDSAELQSRTVETSKNIGAVPEQAIGSGNGYFRGLIMDLLGDCSFRLSIVPISVGFGNLTT
jgi:hypothetical protein